VGLPELLRGFEHDAEADIAAIARAADAEVARLVDAAVRARDARIAATSAAAASEHRAAAEVTLAAARRAARARVLAARARVLALIRDALAAELVSRLPLLATTLVRAVLDRAGDEPGTLRCAPAIAAAAPAGIRVDPDPAIAGASFVLASGARVDATVSTILARAWPRLACEALS
jgi:vacuolar-type H+-ATPase subunit E/Vma4